MRLEIYAAYLAVALLGYFSRGTRLEGVVVRPLLYTLVYGVVPLAVLRAYALHGVEAFTRYSLVSVAVFAATTPYAILAARRVCNGRPECKPVALLTILFPNTVFLPLSLAPLQHLDVDVVMSYSLPLTLLHFTLGYRLGGAKPRRDVPGLVASAAAIGLAFNLSGFTQSITHLLGLVGIVSTLSGYMALLVVGASMPRVRASHLRDPLLYYTLAWRSTISPLLHYAAAHALGVTGAPLRTLIVESMMPPATMNAVIARHVGADYERAATAILLLTPVCTAEALAALVLLTP